MRFSFLLAIVFLVACSKPSSETSAPQPAANQISAARTSVPQLTAQELIAIEGTPGSTEPLGAGIEPAPAPVAGIEGIPGPSPAYGPENAPVRIVLFTDFQCPVCPRVVEPLKYLVRAYPKDVRLVVKQNALAMHKFAARAAAAALAAFRQGKFWAYHDKLFASRGRLDDGALAAYASEIGLDEGRFRSDIDDAAVAAQVKYEAGVANRLGLGDTPAFVINGVPETGWASYGYLDAAVLRELERAKSIAASGVPPARVAYEATRRAGATGEAAAALFADAAQ